MSALPKTIEERIRKRLQEMKEVIEKRQDPFQIDVASVLEDLRLLLEKYGESVFSLDAEAIESVIEIISEQEEWIKVESSLLGIGPILAVLSLKNMDAQDIGRALLSSWTPLVYRDHLTIREIFRGLRYIEEVRRIRKTLGVEEEGTLGFLSRDYLKTLGIMSEEEFNAKISLLSLKVAPLLENNKQVKYWDVILEDSYAKTVENAVLLAFLISRGEISLKIDPESGEVYIVKPDAEEIRKRFSIAIPLSYEEWVKRHAERS